MFRYFALHAKVDLDFQFSHSLSLSLLIQSLQLSQSSLLSDSVTMQRLRLTRVFPIPNSFFSSSSLLIQSSLVSVPLKPQAFVAPRPVLKALATRPFSVSAAASSSTSTSSFAKSSNGSDIEPRLLSCTMPHERRSLRVAVLLSGGVDSSVALRLLHAAGHRCTAFYLKIWFQVRRFLPSTIAYILCVYMYL